MTALDQAIERPSLRAEAMRRIRTAIVYGEIEPGRIHSAPVLAGRMGVSVTPVREALLELASRGMVEPVRNRGFRVVERSAAELDAALELRELVEVPMVVRLAGRLEPAAAATLSDLVRTGRDAARQGDLEGFLEADRSFHLGLLAAAGNPRVTEVVDRVLDHMRLARFVRDVEAPALTEVADAHGDILAAVVDGDAVEVDRALRDHLAQTRAAWH